MIHLKREHGKEIYHSEQNWNPEIFRNLDRPEHALHEQQGKPVGRKQAYGIQKNLGYVYICFSVIPTHSTAPLPDSGRGKIKRV